MRKKSYLQIEVTTRCNFTCKFCCGRPMVQSDISYETFRQAIDSFPDIQMVHLQGEGEPLLHKEFFDMVQYCNNKNIKVSTITNGSFFTDENIKKILECDMESINISIEFPQAEDFKEFRGGNLVEISEGIRNLLKARNSLSLKKPVVGFTVTILRDTSTQFFETVELYKSLGMDGGISLSFLNESDDYTTHYDSYLNGQILNKDEKEDFLAKTTIIINELNKNRMYKHFYEEIFDIDVRNPENTKFMDSCAWLDKAFYINNKGYVSCCNCVKDTIEMPLGKLGESNINELFEMRDKMSQMIISGQKPKQCNSCSIAGYVTELKRQKNVKHNK